ncbi:MAG TPA: nucleotidyltransferase domain-containing protein [Streptosporangiaceae bacterium]|jgi:predicted nucleotidyltransferase|nr:nucleotidyltransferase domain-containing protein [Streptosporangiaceae bacterium]
MDLPPDVDRLLTALRGRLVARGGLVGLYLYGSLTTGDFSPARSDIDVIAMLAQDPDEAAVRDLGRLHAALAAADDPAGRLHCLYVPAHGGGDPEALRRAGETIRVPALQRISRGYLARRIMQRGVRRLGSLRAGSMQAEGGTR